MTDQSWHIREFDFHKDYGQVANLWKTVGGGVKFSASDTEAEIQKKIQRDPDHFLVVESADQIVGTVLGGFDGRRGMVYHLAVAQSHRGLGIAHALMAEIERRITSKGALKIYLMMNKDHPELIDFYSKMGWSKMDVFLAGKEFYPK
jgi:ribosomal protein S18 acetylase RimI-like enzyme